MSFNDGFFNWCKIYNFVNIICDSCIILWNYIYCISDLIDNFEEVKKIKLNIDFDLFLGEIYLEKVKEIDIKKDL